MLTVFSQSKYSQNSTVNGPLERNMVNQKWKCLNLPKTATDSPNLSHHEPSSRALAVHAQNDGGQRGTVTVTL